MGAAVGDGAAVVAVGGFERNEHGEEAPREALPGDPVLVQPVALHTGRLEDQLVLEETRRLAVDRAEGGEEERVEGEVAAERAQVDDRVERLEGAFAGKDIVLPAAADVALVDEILMLAQEPLGLLDRLLHEQPREERADDDEAVALEVSLERRSRRGGGAHALFLSAAVAPAGLGARQVKTASAAAPPGTNREGEA